jgi:peroxiredoxin
MTLSHSTTVNFATAPDFSLKDLNGLTVSLSDYRNHKNIVLVFNRGFM